MRKNQFWVLLMAFLLTTFLFLLATKQGLLLTYDSRAYLQLSQNSSFQSLINAVWMPLYALLLSFGNIFGDGFGEKNILIFAKIFHLICLLLIILQTFFIIKKHIKITILQYFVLFMVGFSVANLQNAVFLWSEPFFIVLLLQIFILINKENNNTKIFFLLIILSNLLCFQRLAGIIFVGLFSVILLFKDSKYIKNSLKAIFYMLTSISGIIFWFFLKKYYQNTPQLAENLILGDFLANVSSCLLVMLEWFLPSFLLDFLPIFVKISIMILLILIMIFLAIKNRNKLIISLLILVFGYISAICLLALNIPSETDRYISVVQIFFFIGLGASLDNTIFWEKNIIIFKRILLILMLLVLSYNTIRTTKNAVFWSKTAKIDIEK